MTKKKYYFIDNLTPTATKIKLSSSEFTDKIVSYTISQLFTVYTLALKQSSLQQNRVNGEVFDTQKTPAKMPQKTPLKTLIRMPARC